MPVGGMLVESPRSFFQLHPSRRRCHLSPLRIEREPQHIVWEMMNKTQGQIITIFHATAQSGSSDDSLCNLTFFWEVDVWVLSVLRLEARFALCSTVCHSQSYRVQSNENGEQRGLLHDLGYE
jgi:hypothetical protein